MITTLISREEAAAARIRADEYRRQVLGTPDEDPKLTELRNYWLNRLREAEKIGPIRIV